MNLFKSTTRLRFALADLAMQKPGLVMLDRIIRPARFEKGDATMKFRMLLALEGWRNIGQVKRYEVIARALHRRLMLLLLIPVGLMSTLLFPGRVAAQLPPGCEVGEIRVPLLINVLPGVGLGLSTRITDAEIQNIVAGVNPILNQAGICVELDTRNISRGSDGTGVIVGNGDDIFYREEGNSQTCENELAARIGAGRGLKTYLANQTFAFGAQVYGFVFV